MRPCRETRLHRLPGEGSTTRWDGRPLDAADRDRDRFQCGRRFRAAIETGDLTYACYSMYQSVIDLLLRNDPLDAVWRESEKSLDFVRKAKFRDVADIIVSQQRFIATMQGRTATFSTFSDAQFDEAAFEAQLTGTGRPRWSAWYWILKLKARFLSGDYAEALAAADKAKALLWASAAHIQLLDYFYYTALTVAALYENASADEQNRVARTPDGAPGTTARVGRKLSTDFRRQARAGVGRDRPPRRARRRRNATVRAGHSIGSRARLRPERRARPRACCAVLRWRAGSTTAARAYLQDARSCYLALGGARQGAATRPALPAAARESGAAVRRRRRSARPSSSWMSATVVKASQAVSGEIVLGKLIETLMTIALEHAGAERGLLILFPGDEPRIEAEATTGRGQVEVALRETAVTPAELPESVLHYVIRTRESVILDDASAQNPFSADEYIRQKRARSVLCLPLVKQAKLIGVLYLENNLAPHVFTPSRIAVLELLASQAAISLENARLYRDLEEREAKIRRLVDANIIGIFIWDFEGRIIEANEAFLRMVGYDREDLVSGRVRWTDLTPPEWRDRDDTGR